MSEIQHVLAMGVEDTGRIAALAYQEALKHSAEPHAIEALQTRDTLLQILTEANIQADICEDVADTCDLSNLNALAIASGLLSTDKIAQHCFLTKDEAEVGNLLFSSPACMPALVAAASTRVH